MNAKEIIQPETLMTRSEVSAMLRVSLQTLDRLMKEETLKRYRIGRSIRFKKSEVMDFINEGAA